MSKRQPITPRLTRSTGFAAILIGWATVVGALLGPAAPALIGDRLFYLLVGIVILGVGVMIAVVEPR